MQNLICVTVASSRDNDIDYQKNCTRKIVKTPMLFHLIPKKVQAVSMAGLRVGPEEFLLLITPPQQQKGVDKAALHLLWLSIHKGTASNLQKIGRPRVDFHFSKKLT